MDVISYYESFKREERILKFEDQEVELGIDEAGRGPVIGPMVYAAAWMPLGSSEKLKDENITDSKKLTAEQRDSMNLRIREMDVGFIIHSMEADEVSSKMMSDGPSSNLNQMSHNCAIQMIRFAIREGVRVKKLLIDTVGKPEPYIERLHREFPGLDVTVTEKADALFEIVGAASILAKTHRDLRVQEIEAEYGQSIGSGYPHDEDTKNFLAKTVDPIFGFDKHLRFSWSTVEQVLASSNAKEVKWENPDKSQMRLTFAKKNSAPFSRRHISISGVI